MLPSVPLEVSLSWVVVRGVKWGGGCKDVNRGERDGGGRRRCPKDWCSRSGCPLSSSPRGVGGYRFTVSHLGRHENRVKSGTNPTC